MEWALIEPLMPAPNRIGRPRKTDLREIMNALLYMASSGGAWRLDAGQARRPLDGIARHPVDAGPIRSGNEQPVQRGDEHGALHGKAELTAGQQILSISCTPSRSPSRPKNKGPPIRRAEMWPASMSETPRLLCWGHRLDLATSTTLMVSVESGSTRKAAGRSSRRVVRAHISL